MNLDLPKVIDSFGRNKVTPRFYTKHNWKKVIGKVVTSNIFPTFKARLVEVDKFKERCYFEIIENLDYPKYNHCAGKIEYLSIDTVLYMDFSDK